MPPRELFVKVQRVSCAFTLLVRENIDPLHAQGESSDSSSEEEREEVVLSSAERMPVNETSVNCAAMFPLSNAIRGCTSFCLSTEVGSSEGVFVALVTLQLRIVRVCLEEYVLDIDSNTGSSLSQWMFCTVRDVKVTEESELVKWDAEERENRNADE